MEEPLQPVAEIQGLLYPGVFVITINIGPIVLRLCVVVFKRLMSFNCYTDLFIRLRFI